MKNQNPSRPVALSIAGSDSGGGAGIQADLRTFSHLGVFGATAITAVTSQNLNGVTHVAGVDVESVQAQARAVAGGFEIRAMKTGMLWRAETVETVAALVSGGLLPAPVVDPVMVATSGARLLEPDAVAAYESTLFPLARVITPNLDEAALLLGSPMNDADLEAAGLALAAKYGIPVLLKGGHAEGDPVDLLCSGHDVRAFRNRRVHEVNTHGSGCTLSAAIAAYLARGLELGAACESAITFLHTALTHPVTLEDGTCLIGIENT